MAKNSNVKKDALLGNELIDLACDVIATSVEVVGGRYIMVECRKEKKLVQFYEQNLFSEIARIPDNEQPMVQMIRKII